MIDNNNVQKILTVIQLVFQQPSSNYINVFCFFIILFSNKVRYLVLERKKKEFIIRYFNILDYLCLFLNSIFRSIVQKYYVLYTQSHSLAIKKQNNTGPNCQYLN